MLNLSNVTLLCVETREPELAHWAIDQCLKGTQFAKVVLITDLEKVRSNRVDIEYVQAPPIRTTKDYSELLLTGLDQYVEGSHVLVIQWDSFITNPELWESEFLNYDYIGAVWPHHPKTAVGNGGFSLRSVKLLNAMKKPGFVKRHPEDYCICVDNKEFLKQECGIRIAPTGVAEQFSVERSTWHPSFGFHGFFNFGRVLNDFELKAFIKILPYNYLNGLDGYDLIYSLQEQGRVSLAKEIAAKVRFKWKMRKRFLKLKFWQLSAK
ncbi:DUF5672 family protein [Polynucleobacter sp. MWH-UH35A]|uniref:DUF5672 family protein n=1 Tax=Polynucleobacter sp. MWH-UH35A TaxID=1855619 RepID=UPI001BFD1C47|nr:DUF5672 family protein [Polynucleobacter sp. MWH-UH35A]QWD60366.1 hypothetical protein ICV36_01345 [Polynucleobacter sp. MWH-UH35A]